MKVECYFCPDAILVLALTDLASVWVQGVHLLHITAQWSIFL